LTPVQGEALPAQDHPTIQIDSQIDTQIGTQIGTQINPQIGTQINPRMIPSNSDEAN
jgi:hypothetical protein